MLHLDVSVINETAHSLHSLGCLSTRGVSVVFFTSWCTGCQGLWWLLCDITVWSNYPCTSTALQRTQSPAKWYEWALWCVCVCVCVVLSRRAQTGQRTVTPYWPHFPFLATTQFPLDSASKSENNHTQILNPCLISEIVVRQCNTDTKCLESMEGL